MQLNLKSFQTILTDAAVAVQATATQLINLDPGSTLRAILEANASVASWVQALIYNVLLTTRLATSGGTDVDSWGQDFGFFRLPAVPSSGTVTFSRFTFTQPAEILPGVTVTSLDSTQTFIVSTDILNINWSPSSQSYILPAGTQSIDVPVSNTVAGSAGNVGVGIVGLISSTIPFIDTVTNNATFSNGADAESDANFKLRFISYIASLSRGTLAAIGFAINSVEQGLTYTIQENTDPSGNFQPGHLVITVDNGTGTPSTNLLSLVATNVELYRAATISYDIFPPTIVNANVVFTLTPKTGFDFSALVTDVENAVISYINTLGVGQPLYYSRIAQVAYDSVDGIGNISLLTVNGGTTDLTITPRQVIKTTSVVINS